MGPWGPRVCRQSQNPAMGAAGPWSSGDPCARRAFSDAAASRRPATAFAVEAATSSSSSRPTSGGRRAPSADVGAGTRGEAGAGCAGASSGAGADCARSPCIADEEHASSLCERVLLRARAFARCADASLRCPCVCATDASVGAHVDGMCFCGHLRSVCTAARPCSSCGDGSACTGRRRSRCSYGRRRWSHHGQRTRIVRDMSLTGRVRHIEELHCPVRDGSRVECGVAGGARGAVGGARAPA